MDQKLDYSKIKKVNVEDIAKAIQPDIAAFIKNKGRDRLNAPLKVRRLIKKVVILYFKKCAVQLIKDASHLNLYRIGTMRMVKTEMKKIPKKVYFKRHPDGTITREYKYVEGTTDGRPYYFIDWDRPIKYKRFKFKPSKQLRDWIVEARKNDVPVLTYNR